MRRFRDQSMAFGGGLPRSGPIDGQPLTAQNAEKLQVS
jgi:hypothetical protein